MSAPDQSDATIGALSLPAQIHATAVVLGECGVLIKGASGSGKSSLARKLLALSRQRGDFSCLIGDDIIRIAQAGRHLLAKPHPAIPGQMEVRGLGILNFMQEPAAILHCVIDLEGTPAGGVDLPRVPENTDSYSRFGGLLLPRLRLLASRSPVDNAEVTLLFLEHILVPCCQVT